jgi:hypothetical protein
MHFEWDGADAVIFLVGGACQYGGLTFGVVAPYWLYYVGLCFLVE